MRKPVNWVLELWHGRVYPGHRAFAVFAAILINLIVMGVLFYHGVLSKIHFTPSIY